MRIAINGFGRIGRVTARAIFDRIRNGNPTVELVAVNDLADLDTLSHLFKYDSVHGRFNGTLSNNDNTLIVNETNKVQFFQERDPLNLPWADLKIDLVIESTGLFRSVEEAGKHVTAGAKRVMISAPPKGKCKTIVLGINDHTLTPEDKVFSNASCTTNCAAPMISLLEKHFGIEQAYITTIHSYTGDQRLHDAPHADLRRARAAAYSIVPTTTGAAKAITKIFPNLEGKIGGCGIRVPVPDGSLTDITCHVKKGTTVEEVNSIFKLAAENELKGILSYEVDQVVSIDIIGSTYSCIYNEDLTSVINESLVKIVGWYDNETGYSNRLLDMAEKISDWN
jgi:glyceraldehyde 3-phosphate dehydrogenase